MNQANKPQPAPTPAPSSRIMDYIKSWPLYLLPHHGLSRCIFFLTRIESSLKNPFVRWFIRTFKVDMSEALEPDITRYKSFNAFFTRALKPDARPINEAANILISPVDGAISQIGAISNGRIIQAKGRDYSLFELLGGRHELSNPFMHGQFATLYLSPRDYHRIHMPVDGTLQHMIYVPGRLFSVAQHTARVIPNLFARNERVIAFFENDQIGPFAMVLVGAINVAAIETVWHGLVTPPHQHRISEYEYHKNPTPVYLKKGQEMGRFNMGSTVILVTNSRIAWDKTCTAAQAIKLGQPLALINDN